MPFRVLYLTFSDVPRILGPRREEVVKSLTHNGIYIPEYSPVGLNVKAWGHTFQLSSLAEQMAVAMVRKEGTPYMDDPVFVLNFTEDFVKELSKDEVFREHLEEKIGITLQDICLDEVRLYLASLKLKIEAMTKEEKKKATELKKVAKEKLKEKYGFATLDGKRIALSNWIAEPAGIFMSKGKNSLRGRWKRAVGKDEITLNLSRQPSNLEKGWKGIVWRPTEMWIASFKSPLDGKTKYVWTAPSSHLNQEQMEKKWGRSEKLKEYLPKIEELVKENLASADEERRKLATVVWLIKELGIRVGDEKIAGEHGTVGCTTLRSENIQLFLDGKVILDFIGKDYIRWKREFFPPQQVWSNLLRWNKHGGDFIFAGIDSNKVAKFLREVMPGLSAKVFRTYIAGKTFKEAEKCYAESGLEPLPRFKYINGEVARKLNHKRTPPKGWEERKEKKVGQIEVAKKLLADTELKAKDSTSSKEILCQVKKAEVLKSRIAKMETEKRIMDDWGEWNLGTSLASYISPRYVVEYAQKHQVDLGKLYSKALLEKFAWALK